MNVYALLALTQVISASNVLVDRAPVPGVVSIPYSRGLAPLQRRGDSFVDVSTGASYSNYIVNITVGTPAQPVTLSLDTGSSDTILLHQESSLCSSGQNAGLCPSVGYYNANKSSSYKYIASNFSSNFGFPENGQGSSASGDVALDTFNVAGAILKDQRFNIAYGDASIGLSILGLSYQSGENGGPYNNFPLSLAKSGAINLPLFSLWKNAPDSHDGQVLFGGVDTTKYTGSLLTLDTQTRPKYPAPIAFDVLLNGVKLSGNSSFPAGSTGSVLHVLDCGTSYTLLPNEWAQPIYDQFSVTYFKANDTAYVDCAFAQSDYTIDFTFGSLTIQVPLKIFVSLRSVKPDICSFGIVPAGTRIALLGDNFLSSAYAVFDLANNKISLAARNFAATTDSIVAVPAGGVKAIPSGATGVTPTSTGSSPTGTESKKSSATTLSFSGAAVGLMFVLVAFTSVL